MNNQQLWLGEDSSGTPANRSSNEESFEEIPPPSITDTKAANPMPSE